MKVHAKKKAYRLWLKQQTLKGYINDTNGHMVGRHTITACSMTRDYYPQRSKG